MTAPTTTQLTDANTEMPLLPLKDIVVFSAYDRAGVHQRGSLQSTQSSML